MTDERLRSRALGVGARLGEPIADEMLATIGPERNSELVANLYFQALNAFDLAHAVMLTEQGIISRETGAQLLNLLLELETIPLAEFPIDPAVGDLLINKETYHTDRLGEAVAGRLHTGRSRGDTFQGVLQRLAERQKLLELADGVIAYERALLDLAAQHVDTVMPGYSHLQHAQPTTFAHYLVSFAYPAERDLDRILAAFGRANRSPAGSGIGWGSGYPINRHRTAELLGFDGVIHNTRDAVWSPDHILESLHVASLVSLNLARIAADMITWSSYEFRMVELADRFCSTSSIMPQKKNPYALEYLRGLSAMVSSTEAGFQSIYKLPSDGVDSVVFQPRAFDSIGKVAVASQLMAAVLRTLTVKTDVMAERAGADFSQVTDLADLIVIEKGLAFRTAHRIAGTLVRRCLAAGIRPSQVTVDLVEEAAQTVLGHPLDLAPEIVQRAMDPSEGVRRRAVLGGPARDRVLEQLEETRGRLDDHEAAIRDKRDRIESAHARLLARAKELCTA